MSDSFARILALKAKRLASEANSRLDNLPKGVNYKGSVNYFNDLPTNAEVGDMYTVKYKGTTGTTPDEREFVWGNDDGTLKWIEIGADSKLVEVTYGVTTYAEITALINQGKVPYLFYNNLYYEVSSREGNYVYFIYKGQYSTSLLRINSASAWYSDTTTLERTTNKETTLTPTSTTKYPSSKAVADYVAQHSGGGWTLLWENASPGSSFNPQTLNFTKEFNNIVVIFRIKYSDTTPKENLFIKRDETSNSKISKLVLYGDGTTTQTLMLAERSIEARGINMTNGVVISSAYLMTLNFSSGSAYTREVNNTYLIPIKIYGFN